MEFAHLGVCFIERSGRASTLNLPLETNKNTKRGGDVKERETHRERNRERERETEQREAQRE